MTPLHTGRDDLVSRLIHDVAKRRRITTAIHTGALHTLDWLAQERRPSPLGEGQRISRRFELGEELGRGGFGRVHRATELGSGREVAVKLVERGGGLDEGRNEAAALRLLDLPGVVPWLEDGEQDGLPWVVMELASGRPFPTEASPWSQVGGLVLGLLEVLGRVHDAGVIHRDIKPGNVLVDDQGAVRVLDFGIADARHAGITVDAAGTVVGTPAYMAPEQVLGVAPDARSDLYAVGVMAYEALMGGLPHDATTARSAMLARLDDPAPELPEHVAPPGARALVRDLLERDPRRRPLTAWEAASRLVAHVDVEFELPWLGAEAFLDSVAARLRGGEAVALGGPAGSGRRRAAEEVAERLRLEGTAVVTVEPHEELLGGPREAFDVPADHGDPVAEVSRRARAHLDAGGVIVVPDATRLDRLGLRLLEGLDGAVLRTVDGDAGTSVPTLGIDDLLGAFGGPTPLFHTAEDACALLHERTAGLPGLVVQELAAWRRAGLATWHGDRFEVPRAAVDRVAGLGAVHRTAPMAGEDVPWSPLAVELVEVLGVHGGAVARQTLTALCDAPGWQVDAELEELAARDVVMLREERVLLAAAPSLDVQALERRDAVRGALIERLPADHEGRLWLRIAAGDLQGAAGDAERLADASLARQRSGEAARFALEGLDLARRVDVPGQRLADLSVRACMESSRADLLARAVEVLRRLGFDDRLVWAETALAVLRAQGDREPATVEDLPSHPDPALEAWRQTLLLWSIPADRGTERARVMQDILAERPSDPTALDRWLMLASHVAFSRARFDEAVDLCLEAGAHRRSQGWDELSARVNRLMNLHAGGRVEEAASLAAALQAEASTLRRPVHEAYALWGVWFADYRLGRTVSRPDGGLLRASGRLQAQGTTALLLLPFVASSWRRGTLDRDTAGWLLGEFGRADRPDMRALASLVAAHAGHTHPSDHWPAALAARFPGIAVQLGALLVDLGVPAPAGAREALLARFDELPPRNHHLPAEFLSYDECRALLAGDPRPDSLPAVGASA